MQALTQVGPAFVAMAHRIVWCSVDRYNWPRSRILHPAWEWDGTSLVGWIGTVSTSLKRALLDHSPFVSCNY